MATTAPVLFLIFNRPDVTQVTFACIREAKPAKLYVAADGPRKNKPGEDLLCKKTRDLIQIDWPCELKTLYRESNLGCGRAVSAALNWFFEQEESGIIIEDDILPHPSFFEYCQKMLEKYKDDESVMHINGCNFQDGIKRGDGSYYFSAFPHVWGWAGWRRAWKRYDFNLSDVNYFYNLNKLAYYFRDKKIWNYWYPIFFKMNQKMIDTWDYQWNYAIWNSKGKVITPQVNMISNIGFNEQATHTTDPTNKFANRTTFEIRDLKHPVERSMNREADLYTFINCY